MMTDYLIIFAISFIGVLAIYGAFDMLKQINKLDDKK
jgi:uncharacterized membrane protein